MKIEKLRISKVFYGKWPFKIECYLEKASLIPWRHKKIRWPFQMERNKPSAEITALHDKFEAALATFSSLETGKRVESNHYNVFCKDLQTTEKAYEALKEWVVRVQGPATDEEENFLNTNGHKKVLCEVLPYEKFKYRVYFKTNMHIESRKKVVAWSNKNPDKTRVSQTTKQWLVDVPGTRWTQGPFTYVEDDKTLSMLCLSISSGIKKIEEFIPRNSINTP